MNQPGGCIDDHPKEWAEYYKGRMYELSGVLEKITEDKVILLNANKSHKKVIRALETVLVLLMESKDAD